MLPTASFLLKPLEPDSQVLLPCRSLDQLQHRLAHRFTDEVVTFGIVVPVVAEVARGLFGGRVDPDIIALHPVATGIKQVLVFLGRSRVLNQIAQAANASLHLFMGLLVFLFPRKNDRVGPIISC